MLGEILLAVEFLTVLVTLLYIGRLLLLGNGEGDGYGRIERGGSSILFGGSSTREFLYPKGYNVKRSLQGQRPFKVNRLVTLQ